MPASSLLALLLPPVVLQADAVTFVGTSSPTSGVFVEASEDGTRLVQGRGAHVVELDLARILAWELADDPDPDVAEALRWEVPLDASITAALVVGDDTFVGGGDSGLFRIGPDGSVAPVDTDTGGRWCFDLAVGGGELHALFGALDATELRSYDVATGERTRTVKLDVAAGLHRPGIGRALAPHGDDLWVALGVAGLARVAPDGSVHAALDVVPESARASAEETALHRARDVAVVEDRLVVAADASGLLELDLAAAGSPPAPAVHAFEGHYPIRVDAVVDPETGRHVVAVGTAPAPSAAHEWGPYYSYGAFDGMLRPPGIVDTWRRGCGTSLFVFEGAPGARLRETLFHAVDGSSGKRSWKSLDLVAAEGRFWVLDNEPTVWSFERGAGSRLGRLTQRPSRRYADVDVSYASGIRSLADPNLLLAGEDDARAMGFYRVEGTTAEPRLVPLEGTDHRRFNLGLLMNGQWISPATGREWLATGTGEYLWRVVELTTSSARPEQLLEAGPGEWKSHYLAFPEDPQLGRDDVGWSYSTAAADPGGDLVAFTRSHAATPITLFLRSEIEYAEANLGPRRSGRLRPLPVEPLGSLALHPDLAPPVGDDAMADLHVGDLHFFRWDDEGTPRRVLAVAAGVEVAGSLAGRAKLAFVYLDDVVGRGSEGAALYRPGAATDPATHTMAYGSSVGALMWDVTIGTVDGAQYAFACDTSGAVSVFALGGLFRGRALEEVARWELPPSVLDGRGSPIIDIELRREGGAPYLYLAANRRGVVKLRVDGGAGGLELRHELTLPTPGQAAGLVLGTFQLSDGPLEALVVFDHEDAGIRLYRFER